MRGVSSSAARDLISPPTIVWNAGSLARAFSGCTTRTCDTPPTGANMVPDSITAWRGSLRALQSRQAGAAQILVRVDAERHQAGRQCLDEAACRAPVRLVRRDVAAGQAGLLQKLAHVVPGEPG